MIIIGITGTYRAGKGVIVNYLMGQKQFKHYSVRAFIAEEVKKRGLPVNRDSLVNIGNELRKEHSPSYIAEQLYEQAAVSRTNCIIESIRTVGEVEALSKKGDFYLFAIDADIKERYKRAIEQASETDYVSFDEFKAQEQGEMHSDDPNKQNLSRCIGMADYRFINNGTLEELYMAVDWVLEKIGFVT